MLLYALFTAEYFLLIFAVVYVCYSKLHLQTTNTQKYKELKDTNILRRKKRGDPTPWKN